MKLFLDYKVTNEPYGGIQTFFKNFIECSENYSDVITLVNDYKQADVIFFGANSRGIKTKISIKDVEAYGKSKALVIHRLDGLRKGSDSFVRDTERFVDGYVFQSNKGLEDYSSIKKPSVIIHNGVNQEKFYVKATTWNRDRKLRCLFVSWSDSLNKGFSEYATVAQGNNMKCSFVGRWPSSVRPNFINVEAPKSNDLLPAIYRYHDVLIFPSRLESCSNVVLEALSSGLPVVYYRGSGVDEIAGVKYGIPLINFNWWDFYTVLKLRYKEFQDNIRRDIKQFSMNKTIEEYLSFFHVIKLRKFYET